MTKGGGRIDAMTRAARDLLAALDDAEALACNPLSCHLFLAGSPRETALRRVRQWVVAALDDMAAQGASRSSARLRRRELLARYDMGGEPCAEVARGAGISVRHFYRERRIALAEFAAALQRVQSNRAASSATHSAAHLRLRAAFQTAAAGNTAAALRCMDELGRPGRPSIESTLARLAAAQLSFDGENVDIARRELQAAESALATLSLPSSPSHGRDLTALLEFAKARLTADAGDLDQALQRANRAMEHFALRSVADVDAPDAVAFHLALRESLNLAVSGWNVGRTDVVRAALGAARRIGERLPLLPPYLRIEMLNVATLVHAESESDDATAPDAAQLAWLHGYPGLASDALGLRAWAAMRRGDTAAAVALQRRAVEAAEMTDSTYQIGTALTHHALIETRADPRRALALARAACERLRERPLQRAYAALALGRAQLLCNDVRGAIETSRMLCEASGKLTGNPTVRGAALRLSAYCALATGNTRSARDDIEASIDVLRRGAPTYSLKASYRARSEIVAMTATQRRADIKLTFA